MKTVLSVILVGLMLSGMLACNNIAWVSSPNSGQAATATFTVGLATSTPPESNLPELKTPRPELPPISVENVSQFRPLAEVKEVADYSLRWDKHVGEVSFIKEKLFIESINQTLVWQWDGATRQLLFGHTLPTQDMIAISPDGKTLATECQTTIRNTHRRQLKMPIHIASRRNLTLRWFVAK